MAKPKKFIRTNHLGADGAEVALLPPFVYCERCEHVVTPRMDRGDTLCPRCGLVL